MSVGKEGIRNVERAVRGLGSGRWRWVGGLESGSVEFEVFGRGIEGFF